MSDVDPDFGNSPDRQVIARQVVAAKRRQNKQTPSDVDVATAITDIDTSDMKKGSSTIVVTIADPGWVLLDSGFFDANADGRLDPIDVNYPDGSRLWWRLTQVQLDDSGHENVEMTFMERSAVYMMDHHGPLKTSRAKHTRAEFLKSLCDRVKAGGGITFHSRELHVTQPVAGEPKPKAQSRRNKDPGITPSDKLRIAGAKANAGQLREVEIALGVANDINPAPPELAVIAMLCAGIGESSFGDKRGGSGNAFIGVFQGQPRYFGSMSAEERTAKQAHYFLVGGNGYGGGGAIAQANAHPDKSPGLIAADTEVSYPNQFLPNAAAAERYYGKWKREAELLLEAYGGGGGFGGTVYRKQYNFEVGSTEAPHEDFWDASNRVADEVEWPFFLDGTDAYFDSEMTLIKQKPVAVINRGDAAVVGFNVTWDTRHIATQAELVLICDPFEFRAGEVFKLEDFGPASTGSTATPKALPGRWLIEEADRKPTSEVATTFTLKQPTRPKREPAPDTGERTDPAQSGGDISGTPKQIIDTVVLPIAREVGIAITPLQVSQANATHGPTQGGGTSDHQGPPDHAWAADMGIGPDIRGGGNPGGAKKGDRLAKALAAKFDITWHGHGIANSYKTIGGKRYRFQLIWRFDSAQAGNHFTHVHFGVRRVAKYGGQTGKPLVTSDIFPHAP